MWAALVAVCGYLPVPLGREDYIELMPVSVGQADVDLSHVVWVEVDLPPASGPGGGGAAAVLIQAGVVVGAVVDADAVVVDLLPLGVHEIPWIHRDHVHAPMGETAWRHIRAALHRRVDRERHEAALADAADQVLRRSRPLHHSPAAAPTPSQPADSPPETLSAQYPARGPEDSLDAAEARAQAEAHADVGADEAGAHPLPVTGALTLYDADQEAELW
jgi:hypothetical protein